jgi:hypothetical protein
MGSDAGEAASDRAGAVGRALRRAGAFGVGACSCEVRLKPDATNGGGSVVGAGGAGAEVLPAARTGGDFGFAAGVRSASAFLASEMSELEG